MPKAAARLSDMTQHGGVIMPPCALKTMIEMLPAARVTDMHVCPMVTVLVPHVGGPIILGSFTVFIEFLPAARVQDMLICVGPPDMIAMGAMKTFIGDPAGGASSTMSPPPSAASAAGGGDYKYTVGPLGDITCPDGAATANCTTEGDPIDVATGRVFTSATDFEITTVRGLNLTRVYSTCVAHMPGVFGYGWSSRLDERIDITPDVMIYFNHEGRRIVMPKIPPDEEYLFHLDEKIMVRREADGMSVEDTAGLCTLFSSDDGSTDAYVVSGFRDYAGNSLTMERTNGHIDRMGDHAGHEWTIESQTEPFVRIKSIRHRKPGEAKDEPVCSYDYNLQGDLQAVRNALGYTTQFQYDPIHRLVQRTDGNGYAFSFQYDKWNRCVRTRGQDGLYDLALFYSDKEPLTTVRDSVGSVRQYYHNPLGLVTRKINATGAEELFDYQGTNLVKHTDALGRVTEYTYDKTGKLTDTKLPSGASIASAAFAAGVWPGIAAGSQPLANAVTDARGAMLGMKGEAQLSGLSAAGGRATTPSGDELPTAVALEFDKSGRLFRSVFPLGQTYDVAYDVSGRPVSIAGPLGAKVKYAYDPIGRLIGVARPSSTGCQFHYDAENNLTSFVDGAGRATRFEYGRFNLLTSAIDPSGTTVNYEYDTAARLRKITDPGNAVTSLDFDPDDRLQRVMYADGTSEVASYDAAGQLSRFQQRNGMQSTWSFDTDGNPTEVRWPDGSFLTFNYDSSGRIVEATNSETTVEFEHDKMGQLIREAGETDEIAYNYNEIGQLTELAAASVGAVFYEYDANGNVTAVVDWTGDRLEFDYSDLGTISRRRMPGGLTESVEINSLGLTVSTRLVRDDSDQPLAERTIGYDGTDLVVQTYDSISGTSNYEYDAGGRLISVQRDDIANSETFAYDPQGNLVSNGMGNTYRYDPAGKLHSGGGIQCRHDHSGNIIEIDDLAAGKITHGYNGQNQLTGTTLPDGRKIEYRYDAFGRRISKATAIQFFSYVWAGNQLVMETTTNADGNVLERREYIYRPGSYTPAAMRLNGQRHEFHCDHRGAPIRVTDSTGEIVWSATYTGFGEAEILTARITQNFRLPGQCYDIETGMHYNRARYYFPRFGRYLTPDPLGLASGLNLYTYAGNDPINRIDPLGKSPSDPSESIPLGAAATRAAKHAAYQGTNPIPNRPDLTPDNPAPGEPNTAQAAAASAPVPAQGAACAG